MIALIKPNSESLISNPMRIARELRQVEGKCGVMRKASKTGQVDRLAEVKAKVYSLGKIWAMPQIDPFFNRESTGPSRSHGDAGGGSARLR
jgi:hypothetical protein